MLCPPQLQDASSTPQVGTGPQQHLGAPGRSRLPFLSLPLNLLVALLPRMGCKTLAGTRGGNSSWWKCTLRPSLGEGRNPQGFGFGLVGLWTVLQDRLCGPRTSWPRDWLETHNLRPAAPSRVPGQVQEVLLTPRASGRGTGQLKLHPPPLPGLQGPHTPTVERWVHRVLENHSQREAGRLPPPGLGRRQLGAPFSLLCHLPKPPPPLLPRGTPFQTPRCPSQSHTRVLTAPDPGPPAQPKAPKERKADSLRCPLQPPLHFHRPRSLARRLRSRSHFLLPSRHTCPSSHQAPPRPL